MMTLLVATTQGHLRQPLNLAGKMIAIENDRPHRETAIARALARQSNPSPTPQSRE
jgi:hypothetical protein